MGIKSKSPKCHARYACDECDYCGDDYYEFNNHTLSHDPDKLKRNENANRQN